LRASVLRTSSAIGVPVVRPSYTPDRISTASASRRAEVWRLRPVARRARSWAKSSGAIAMPGGQPSTTQPIAGPCDSPKVVTRSNWPKVFMCPFAAPRPRSKQRTRRFRRPAFARGRQLADAAVVPDQLGAFDREDPHLPDPELDPGELDVRQQPHQRALGFADLADEQAV